MSNLSDVIGGSNFYGGTSYSFVPDRFGIPNSAIYFNSGYLQVPDGVYFTGDFTFTGWIYLKSYQSWSRLFEFANGQSNDNKALSMSRTTSQLSGFTFSGSYLLELVTTSIINLNEWYFISFVLSGTTGYIYVNGNQVATGNLYVPTNVARTSNFIGKSNWPKDSNAIAIYDEFKIYQGALSFCNLMNEYILNHNGVIVNYCPSNYWPMSNLSDVIGGANLFGGGNYSFVPDRFGTPNSAIYFNKGFLQVPKGVYFSGDFTVTAWIYLKSYQYFSRIFDFANGQENDNVMIAMFEATSQIRGLTYNGPSVSSAVTTPIINLNEWYFISFVLSETKGYIYVNGNQTATGNLYVPNKIIRTSNYIGKSNKLFIPNADVIFDELKIYQVALSPDKIMYEYQISSNNCIYISFFF
jgi:hypothetical protein